MRREKVGRRDRPGYPSIAEVTTDRRRFLVRLGQGALALPFLSFARCAGDQARPDPAPTTPAPPEVHPLPGEPVPPPDMPLPGVPPQPPSIDPNPKDDDEPEPPLAGDEISPD